MPVNKQKVQQIINDIKIENYQLKKVKEGERDLSRKKRVKKLFRKI